MNIVILGYRVAGLDGVSLESVHWSNILTKMGHKVKLVAGELDREGILIPELHFKWPGVAEIHDKVVYGNEDYRKIERVIFALAGRIEGKLRELFRNGGKVDLLVVPNVFSLPMHFPLAVALERTIQEFSIPTIARHHDFWWERERFLKSHMFHFFEHWFPSKSEHIKHTVINSIAQTELKKRTEIDALVIGDTFDFESSLGKIDDYSKYFRRDFGIGEDDTIFLQATRIVPRKRIELSIELLAKLNLPQAVLVVAGDEGDEQVGYRKSLRKIAQDKGVKILFIGDKVDSQRKVVNGKRIYRLWDCYVNSDFVTYPTEVEGFGNQFVEAVYFKKPIILTPYPVYKADIAPLGFEVIEMSEEVSDEVVARVRELIDNPDKRKEIVEKNFTLGKQYFSYEATAEKIKELLNYTDLP